MNLFKETSGQGDNIVVIHGGAASYEDMAPLVNMLSQHYCVTNVGLPGSGHSDWNPDFNTIHDIADALLPILPETAIYVGWSFGGLVCQSIAARYPTRVKQLIGLCTTPKFICTPDWYGVPEPGYLEAMRNALKEKDFKTLLRDYYDYEFAKIKPSPELDQQVEKICENRVIIPNDILYKLMSICDTTDLRQAFQTISCPIDLIFGEEDENIPKAAWNKIKALNPNVKIHEIKGAGHTPFWTHPKEFEQVLKVVI